MKLLITASQADINSNVDPRFGRAPWFVVKDLDSGNIDFVENSQNLNAMQGAGVQSGQKVASLGVSAVITGHVGPKAFHVLNTAGIEIYQSGSCTIEEAIARFSEGSLEKLGNADKPGHW